MKKFSKFCKYAWYISIPLILLLFVLSDVFSGPGLFSKYVLAPHFSLYAEICYYDAIREGDGISALKYAGYMKKFANKAEERLRKLHEDYRPQDHPWLYNYRERYSHAYELLGDYDMALKCLCCDFDPNMTDRVDRGNQEDVKASKPLSLDPDLFPKGLVDWDSYHTKSRLVYKKGLKKEAFVLYCSYPPTDEYLRKDPDGKIGESASYEWTRRITLHDRDREATYARLSCFKTYKEFLDFFDAEYEELGRPEEYADAAARYHAIASESF